MSLITDISNYQHLKRMSSYDHQISTKYNSYSNKGKEEWQKNALRICGNWSEQLSSKGKVYFYNCQTEVSQWQKPTEWNLPDIDKKDLACFIDMRKEPGKRSYNSSADSQAPLKKYRPNEEMNSSSGERNRRGSTNGVSKPLDDMEISPHASPSERSSNHRRSSNAPKPSTVRYDKPPYHQSNHQQPDIKSSGDVQKQPSTFKKLVDVLESLDHLLTTTSSMRNKNGHSCSPNSSSRSMASDSNKVPPPPPPPLNNSSVRNSMCKPMQNRSSNQAPEKNGSTSGNQKNVLADTLNSLVSLLNQSTNGKAAKTTPNSTPQPVPNNRVSGQSRHSEGLHHNNLGGPNNYHGNHSSPHPHPNQNSRLLNNTNSHHNQHLNQRNNLISPSRNFSPASANNEAIVSGSGDNPLLLRDGQAASYRDHRLQKQRSNNDNFVSRDLKNADPECPSEQSAILNGGSKGGNPTSDAFQLSSSVSRNPEDFPSDGIDKNHKLYHHMNSLITSPDMIKYLDNSLVEKFNDNQNGRILTEISSEAKKFDQLHNVLYSELSCEMKKLKSLLLFSEVKLECHQKKREALNTLLGELEVRKPLENKSFSDLIM